MNIRGKRCVYCGKSSSTKDHVPPKLLLEKPYTEIDNWLTIPSCLTCNRNYSNDEEYFLNVLVEISSNPTLRSKKEGGGTVERARNRSIGLKKRIENSLLEMDDQRVYLNPDYHRIKNVVEKIALGLFFHRYSKFGRLSSFNFIGIYPYSVMDTRPSDVRMLLFSENFKSKKWTAIQAGVLSYIVVKDWGTSVLLMIICFHNSVWCLVNIPHPNAISPKNWK